MMKKLNKIGAVLMISFFIFAIYIIYNSKKVDKIILNNGHLSSAVITKKMVSKGNVGYFTFKFSIDNQIYYFERSVSDAFYKKNDIGDTIIVKYIHSKLPDAFIMEEIKFQKCFGKQPNYGWKELPKCK